MNRMLHLLVTPAAGGPWNMAVDEWLLQRAAQGVATLRFYGWAQPTISLGYFQRSGELPADVLGLPQVRRLTGGGAILHQFEITYSLALPGGVLPADLKQHGKPGVRHSAELYARVHRAFAAGLRRMGLQVDAACGHSGDDRTEARLCQKRDRVAGSERSDGPDFAVAGPSLRSDPATPRRFLTKPSQPFWCFERSSGDDLTCGNRKALGSAQRRRGSAVLQHGSLLISPSRFLPHLLGLDLPEADAARAKAWVPALAREVADALDSRLTLSEIAPSQRATLEGLVQSRYASAEWTHRRR